jgi:hypothetical protein
MEFYTPEEMQAIVEEEFKKADELAAKLRQESSDAKRPKGLKQVKHESRPIRA